MLESARRVLRAAFVYWDVGVAHAGWRGLADGVIESAVESMQCDDLLAWMGPAIGPCHYQVRSDVREAFESDLGFSENGDGSYQMDLSEIARYQLESLGVLVSGGGFCTYCDAERFFSYRRDGVTGRMGGFIWIRENPAQ